MGNGTGAETTARRGFGRPSRNSSPHGACVQAPDLRAAWHEVRRVLDRSAADPADHAFLTAPRVPHKALVRMRLAGDGDLYVPVHNPLHAS